ncbi:MULTISPECIES: amino acid decarboxylase [unclassified Dehalobacter]|uniref:aminotransferase class I/II-fold pyridoxal phosphate-dependent enzyme n=1 Tax=unclassified Dehalobacter TaxID=2635733 RepID=UPI000E6BC6C5|nr:MULTISPECIES: amino acid decarboxylase [unclassified Dehalobacter]RJE47847.1 amino acid decarboxylase [Dehalobacter sp. MCB1]TCX49001.1 amino acid decarboxylase [Dehalobacter sp. 14DCB1]TCX56677.1 amino acid decarboxylase [Dehalobacter sp. 12DCB1]
MDSLKKGLDDYCGQRMVSFHTPGHKGSKELLSGMMFPDYDLTELPELDMLHHPHGIIAEAQKRAAEAYGSEETFFLINGGTAGNQAMFAALMAGILRTDRKVRIDRRAHRSVFGALIVSGISPEYIAPIIHPDFHLALGMNAAEYSGNLAGIGALHLTSPSYYGTVTDLKTIIKQRDRNAPLIPILVDQAHGSHLQGGLFPAGAVAEGADLVLHSSHKTLAALTQAGMLHVQGSRVNRTALKKSLEFLQTSSPSYLLMASLETALEGLTQTQIWQDLYVEVCLLHQKLEESFRILTGKDSGKYGIYDVDWSKILINVSGLGLTAFEAVDFLRKVFQIEPELWDKENILFMLGVGSRPEDVRHLTRALEYLVDKYRPPAGQQKERRTDQSLNSAGSDVALLIPPMHLTPREAWLAAKRSVKLKDALGLISAETISIYPPGIPIIAAGEEITSFVLEYLDRARGYNWQGWDGLERGEILAVNI